MRHVPTSLYIDTEFFKRQGLRFDTKVFTIFTETFAKGGLRLLVPVIMERELLRHFRREAEKAADALIKAHKTHPISSLGLAEIPSLEELQSKCAEEMKRQWSSFKEHFVVENLPIAGCLEDVVDWYFEVSPPFSEKKPKEFPDAFIISALDQYHRVHYTNIAVIGFDGDFNKACASRRYVSYFPDLDKYIEAFQPELSGEDRLPGDIDLTKPITTEDLSELKAILGRGGQVTPIEIQRVMQLLARRGTNYDYFFQNANDVIWLTYLSEAGYFLNPPDAEMTPDGRHIVSWWPPLEYLIRVFDVARDEVINEAIKIPKTDNFRVVEGILKIALKAESAQVLKQFSSHFISFVDNCHWGHELIIELLSKPYIFEAPLADITPGLLLKLVEFLPDRREAEKLSLRKENANSWETSLDPTPRFDQWEYQQILENGVRPLAEKDPYQVARILIDATASMIRLGRHQDDIDKGVDNDYSEFWCPRLDKPGRDFQDVKGTLVHTLTYACEQVYKKSPESIQALDLALRNQQWKLFKRLRQYLYASYPSDQTLPWIRELILGYGDYSKWVYHYEFQLMIREACKHFGVELLSDLEKAAILDAILSGPSKDDFREWVGDRFSEEAFQQRQRYFHRMQLHPFAELLRGKYRLYFEELQSEEQKEPITDDSYSPYGVASGGGFVTYRSPKDVEELNSLTDEALLDYLNNWDEESRDKGDWLIEINIAALADVFQACFKSQIVSNDERLSFWMIHRDDIARPIYISALTKAMQELVKVRNFEKLDQWIEFCEWILSHPDQDREERKPELRSESREHPDWGSARRSVVDFIDICLNKDVDAPISARDGIAKLLRLVCTQFDWRLDRDHPVLLNRDDQITEAINNTRSRALESLVNFGFWIRRHRPEDSVPEVTDILEKRLLQGDEARLTRPEQAILGLHFGDICILNLAWANRFKNIIFPHDNIAIWRDAFGSFIKFNHAAKLTFEVLRADFEFALDQLNVLKGVKDSGGDLIDRIGQHLFTYYLWQVYPLSGKESLLSRFYEKTDEDHHFWARLFDHVGRSLKNSGRHLESELTDRVITFFDWRLDVGEPLELYEFSCWLEAECLKPEWRLRSYSKILDLGGGKDVNFYMEVSALNKMLHECLPLVVECFAKITDAMAEGGQHYVPTDEVKSILKAGLSAKEAQVRENAERAKENLLRIGRFDFLDM